MVTRPPDKTEHDDAVNTLSLLLTPGVGTTRTARFLAAARQVGKPLGDLLNVTARCLADMLPGAFQELCTVLTRYKPHYRDMAHGLIERVTETDARAVLFTDPDYPPALKASLGEKAPPLLFVQGNVRLLHEPMAGIVGARQVSRRGEILAEQCARIFAENGIGVVSGAARGVDTAAHRSVIGFGGKTVLILPQGLLTYTAPRAIQAAIGEGRAALVSEFAPDAVWATYAAVTRNATIASLARVLCVIEPRRLGGSIRTARVALGHGKRVLVYGRGAGAELLRNCGALELVDMRGRLDHDLLVDLWKAGPRRLARQADLF